MTDPNSYKTEREKKEWFFVENFILFHHIVLNVSKNLCIKKISSFFMI